VVYLHLGAMKTGSTYLQQLMYANRDALRDVGVELPGATWGAQVRGVQDVLRLNLSDRYHRSLVRGAWADLSRSTLRSPHPVQVISMEFLGFASSRGVARVLESLEEAEVHAIVTVRDMTTALPALWQTLVHNGMPIGWEEFMRAAAEWQPGRRAIPGRRQARDRFRRSQDVPAVLARWAPRLPPGHLHVVTVPPTGAPPELLWQRFALVLGVDPAVATLKPPEVNASIGLASTELIRHVNQRLKRVPQSEYDRTMKHLALSVLSARADREGRAVLTPAGYDAALRWNRAVREALAQHNTHVVGDLTDLPDAEDPDVSRSLPDTVSAPTDRQILRAARSAVRGLDALVARQTRRLRRRGIEVHPPMPTPVRRLRATWRSAPDPVDAAATTVARKAETSMTLVRQLRETAG
jgi:hypothetical protein